MKTKKIKAELGTTVKIIKTLGCAEIIEINATSR
jgi:hypothetical protein